MVCRGGSLLICWKRYIKLAMLSCEYLFRKSKGMGQLQTSCTRFCETVCQENTVIVTMVVSAGRRLRHAGLYDLSARFGIS